jgi:dihydroorotate dehydrogenase
MTKESVDLSVDLGRLKLKNPVMPSSGTFGYGIEFTDFLNLDDLGAIVVKGTTFHPRLGNFQHRFTEIAGCAEISTNQTWRKIRYEKALVRIETHDVKSPEKVLRSLLKSPKF